MKIIKPLMVRSVFGEYERLSDYTVTRNDEEGSFKSISVSITKTETNQHAFDLVTNLNYLEYEGDTYVITIPRDTVKGKTLGKQVSTIYKPIWDLDGKRVRETFSGSIRPKAMLEFILNDSGFSFEIDEDGFETSVAVENFGSDSCKNLLTTFKDRFECELMVIGNKVYAAKFFGRQTDQVLKHRFNISDIVKEMDTSEFYTYIRGWGAKVENEDENAPVEYVVVDDYVSPLEEIYPRREAPWVDDERYYNQPALHQRLIRDLNDSLNVSITLTAKQMEDMDLSGIRKGDWVWCFIDPFDIDVRIRVVAVQDTEDPKKDPVFTLGTIKKKMTKRMARYENTQNVVSKVIDERTGRIRDGAINTANLSFSLEKAKGTLPAAKIDGLDIPSYDLATPTKDGLMSSDDFKKLSRINVITNPFIGMTWALLGASMTVDTLYTSKFYHDYASEILGITRTLNYGVSGSRYANSGRNDSFVNRYPSMADADIITIFGGHNDTTNTPIGTMSDRTANTFYGACHVLYNGLMEKYAGKRIGILTPTPTARPDREVNLSRMVAIEKEVAAYYSLPVLDLYSESGLNTKNENLIAQFMPDRLHMNEEGHEIIGRKIAEFIKRL